jgi:GrpB-like predicted nucleotidyltransferase (UPF0157 family)
VSSDQPLEIVDYDPRRARSYRGERDRVRIALATASLRFEHIGSTAVPGLAGTPVVDLMLGAAPAIWETREELRPRIVALGYEDLGDGGLPGRLYFRRRTPLRAYSLSLVPFEGDLWKANLAFRDYLRAHPDEAEGYAKAKREGSKAAAVDGILKRALAR